MTQALLDTGTTRTWNQPWLSSWAWDSLLIISPAFVTSAIALAFRSQLDNSQYMPLWAWVCFVLMVDVSHVYATLFRTYFSSKSFTEHRVLLLAIPLACWTVGFVLYLVDGLLFWRALAYLAVFHFIRQQYGFVALYARKDPAPFEKFKWLDHLCVYAATLFPLIYWHTRLPRNFHWFVAGDFVNSVPAMVADIAYIIYMIVAAAYAIKEVILLKNTGFLNIPKNLIVIGTALSWWVGIIALNSDLAFTMTNVVTHGIPYMALIWLFHHTNKAGTANDTAGDTVGATPSVVRETKPALSWNEKFVRNIILSYAPAFVFFLLVLAYLEEGFWDGLIWREHQSFFSLFSNLSPITDSVLLAVIIPLLSLPQSTHYVLDGFIWRVKGKKGIWSTL